MAGNNQFLMRYSRGARTSVRNKSAAYGYSIVVTAGFAALNHVAASPTLLEIYLFIIGAVAAFALLEASTSHMFREKLRGEPSNVVALGTTFSVVSISAAVGVTSLVGWLIDGWEAWPISAFGSTVTYLLLGPISFAWPSCGAGLPSPIRLQALFAVTGPPF